MDAIFGQVIFVALVIGLIPAYIAKGKGKDFFTWYIYGVLLFFFAMIHAIVLPEKTGSDQTTVQDVKENRVPLKVIPTPDLYRAPLLINLNSPVELVSYSIKIPKDAEKSFANVQLLNTSNKAVAAVKIMIKCFDAFSEPVQGDKNVIEKSLQDLNVEPGDFFGDDTLIDLHELADTRKLQVIVMSVLFTDGSRWNYQEEDLMEVDTAMLEGEELTNLKVVAGSDAVCYAKETSNYWQCVCGKVNAPIEEQCKRCDRKLSVMLINYTDKSVIDQEIRLIEEKEAKIQTVEAEKKRKQTKAAILIGVPIFLAVIVLITYMVTAPPKINPATIVNLDVSYYIDNRDGTIPISDLPIGTRVADPTWEWEHLTGDNYTGTGEKKVVVWIIVAKNHYEGLEPHVTLLAEELIGKYLYDNSTNRGSTGGFAHWGDSGTSNATQGLRPWLNSSGMYSGEGFYQAFSKSFKAVVLSTKLSNRVPRSIDIYNTQDKVFIPSTTELGDKKHGSNYLIGTTYPYFNEYNSNRRRYAMIGGEPCSYWTRTPVSDGFGVLRVEKNGQFTASREDWEGNGVRPALNIKSKTLVSETGK